MDIQDGAEMDVFLLPKYRPDASVINRTPIYEVPCMMSGESLEEKLQSERSLTLEQLDNARFEKSGCGRYDLTRRSAIGTRISALRHKLKNIDRSIARCQQQN